MVAGVSGGLGEYFGIDPVMFRIIFATTAFFGGGGILAYLIAWLAIPEHGSENTGMDRIVAELRKRNIPVWVVVVAVCLAAWIGLFSWWTPWGFWPIVVAGVILFFAFRNRGNADEPGPLPGAAAFGASTPPAGAAYSTPVATPDATVSLQKVAPADGDDESATAGRIVVAGAGPGLGR